MSRSGSAIFVVVENTQFTIISDLGKCGRAPRQCQLLGLFSACIRHAPARAHTHTHTLAPLPYLGNTLFLSSVVRKVE